MALVVMKPNYPSLARYIFGMHMCARVEVNQRKANPGGGGFSCKNIYIYAKNDSLKVFMHLFQNQRLLKSILNKSLPNYFNLIN